MAQRHILQWYYHVKINKKMATVVLDYDVHNVQAQKALDFILSLDIFTVKKKKTGLEKALEEIEKGKVSFVNGPKRKG